MNNSPDIDIDIDMPPFDNLDAAMHAVADTLTPTIPSNIGSSPGNPAQRQVLIRATTADHDRWKQTADKFGMTMSDFIRNCCNDKAAEVLDCQHPVDQRRFYPWAEFCLQCGMRLRG